MAFIQTRNLVSDFTVIDFETSGLSPQSSEIIEMAAIRVRDHEIVEEFSTLVRPRVPISGFITNLTGISQEMLANAPPLESVREPFLAFIQDDILMGHNINFDLSFLAAIAPDFEAEYFDTMYLSRRVSGKRMRHRLGDLCHRHGVENDGAHRALGDCRATLACYLKLKELVH